MRTRPAHALATLRPPTCACRERFRTATDLGGHILQERTYRGKERALIGLPEAWIRRLRMLPATTTECARAWGIKPRVALRWLSKHAVQVEGGGGGVACVWDLPS